MTVDDLTRIGRHDNFGGFLGQSIEIGLDKQDEVRTAKNEDDHPRLGNNARDDAATEHVPVRGLPKNFPGNDREPAEQDQDHQEIVHRLNPAQLAERSVLVHDGFGNDGISTALIGRM